MAPGKEGYGNFKAFFPGFLSLTRNTERGDTRVVPSWDSTWVHGSHRSSLGQSARSQESRGGSSLPKIGYGICEGSQLIYCAINRETSDLPCSNLEKYRLARHT